jgi:hypothetical protein
MKVTATKDEFRLLRISLRIMRDSCHVGPAYDAYPGEMGNKKWQRAYKKSQKEYKIILGMLKDIKGR